MIWKSNVYIVLRLLLKISDRGIICFIAVFQNEIIQWCEFSKTVWCSILCQNAFVFVCLNHFSKIPRPQHLKRLYRWWWPWFNSRLVTISIIFTAQMLKFLTVEAYAFIWRFRNTTFEHFLLNLDLSSLLLLLSDS